MRAGGENLRDTGNVRKMSFVYSEPSKSPGVMEDSSARRDVTRLLEAWGSGQREALDRLLPAVYGELRRIARGQLSRERRQHTLQPTELVHEAFVRLVDQRAHWQNRVHFYGIAATCMRRVLTDYARRKKALKRPRIDPSAEPDDLGGDANLDGVLAINEAIDRLEKTEPRQARIAELRLFADLQVDEIADLLNVSPATVKRDWSAARHALHEVLSERRHDT